MNMEIRAEYDQEADALYVYLDDGATATTVQYDDAVAADLDASETIVGLEILAPHRHIWALPTIADRFAFADRLGEVAAEVRRALTAMTAGQMIMSPMTIDVPADPEASGRALATEITGAVIYGGSLSWGTSVARSRDIEPEEPREKQPA